jgi:hypothetical protein
MVILARFEKLFYIKCKKIFPAVKTVGKYEKHSVWVIFFNTLLKKKRR